LNVDLYALYIQTKLFSVLMYNSADKTQKMSDTTPKWMHAFCSLTYLGAMLASNEALQHVSYPTQVLGKSVKPVPVMILGVLIARKKYHLMKYLGVLTIVIGKHSKNYF